MTTVWPSRRLRFGRSRRTRRGSDDGMEKGPPTVRRWGRVPPPRAGFRVPWFPSGVPRAAEHGNGRHHAKGRRTDPPQGDFQGVGRSGAQGKGVAGRIRPHWIRPATPFWFPWCAGRGSRGVPPPGVEPGAVTKEKTKTVPVGAWARPGRKGSGRARGPVRRIMGNGPPHGPGVRFVGSLLRALGVGRGLRRARRLRPARSARCPRRSGRGSCGSRSSRRWRTPPWCPSSSPCRRW